MSEEELSIFAKGGHLAISPDFVPFETTIANFESTIRNLQEDITEQIGIENERILLQAKPLKSNIFLRRKRKPSGNLKG